MAFCVEGLRKSSINLSRFVFVAQIILACITTHEIFMRVIGLGSQPGCGRVASSGLG